MLSAAVYPRVSTKMQAEEGSSLESQERSCRELAAVRGLAVNAEDVYREDWPGTTLDRPQLNKLREAIKAERYAALICHSTDRLARNPIHLAILAEECEKHNVQLLFVTEPLDSSAEGQLIRYVKGYAAQIEREKIKERTVRGRRARAEKGMMPAGTGSNPLGYQYDPQTGKRRIIESEAEIVRRMFDMAFDGKRPNKIADILNAEGIPSKQGGKWHRLTAYRTLTNPIYMGVTYYGKVHEVREGPKYLRLEKRPKEEWMTVDGVTPAIIRPEMFEAVQQRLGQPTRPRYEAGKDYLLTGHIFCAKCGCRMSGTGLVKGRFRYYKCRGTMAEPTRPKMCDALMVNIRRVEPAVWDVIATILKTPEVIIAEIRKRQGDASHVAAEIARIESELKRLQRRERHLVHLYTLEQVDDETIKREGGAIKRSREGLRVELASYQQERQNLTDLDLLSERVQAFCAEVAERIDTMTFEEKRWTLEALHIRVRLGDEEAEISGAIPTRYAHLKLLSR